MIPFVGHSWVREALEAELPPVAVLRGPDSVGKWTLTEYLAQFHEIKAVDRVVIEKLGPAEARSVKEFVGRAPFGKLKLVVINLNGAGPAALNALLKTLEEPSPKARFLLTTSQPLLSTILSRAHVYRMGLLTPQQVSEVLQRRLGWLVPQADAAAARANGTVAGALEEGTSDVARAAVSAVTRAVTRKDAQLLHQATRGWDEASQAALYRWLRELITGRWQVFSPTDAQGWDPMTARKVLGALDKLPAARARLQVRTVLEGLISGGQ